MSGEVDLEALRHDLAAEGRPTPGAWLRLGAAFVELEEHRRAARRAARIEKAAKSLVHAARDLLERELDEFDEGELPELRALEDALYTTPATEIAAPVEEDADAAR